MALRLQNPPVGRVLARPRGSAHESKAAIGNHPMHPLLVRVPIGAFSLVLIGDIGHFVTADPFWYRFSVVAINLGVTFALFAAAVGAVDYLGLWLNRRATSIATWHALINVAAVSLYAVSDVIRMSGAGLRSGRRWIAVTASTAGFLFLGIAGWLGGKLAHEERVGVVDAPVIDAPAVSVVADHPGFATGRRPGIAASSR
jgi:uncharacterized membrane protein